MELEYSSHFQRSFKKLPIQLQKKAWQKVELFQGDIYHPQLRTNKLKNLDYYAFSVTYQIRVIFRIEGKVVVLVNIGDHSIYQRHFEK